jgi:hypothetical protein
MIVVYAVYECIPKTASQTQRFYTIHISACRFGAFKDIHRMSSRGPCHFTNPLVVHHCHLITILHHLHLCE